MKALGLTAPGSFDNLTLVDLPVPEPGPDEVRVKVEACGLNPVDYKLLMGGHPAWQYPFVLGLDVAGTIDAVGQNVKQWLRGERVFYHGNLARPGGLAEYTCTPAHVLAHIPKGLSWEDAAALPCAGLTAYQAIDRRLHLDDEQTILIHGGSGGVGGFGVQLGHYIGATVISTCSASHIEIVKSIGADYVIDYRNEDVAARVMEITGGRGVDAAVDIISKANATATLKMLAFGGALVCVEALPDFSEWHMFDRAISVHEIALGGAYAANDIIAQGELGHMAAELGALVAAGHISSRLTETVGLEAVGDALQRMKNGQATGKIVAQIR